MRCGLSTGSTFGGHELRAHTGDREGSSVLFAAFCGEWAKSSCTRQCDMFHMLVHKDRECRCLPECGAVLVKTFTAKRAGSFSSSSRGWSWQQWYRNPSRCPSSVLCFLSFWLQLVLVAGQTVLRLLDEEGCPCQYVCQSSWGCTVIRI